MEPGQLPVQVRTLILLVVAARNDGADPAAAARAVMRTPPSSEAIAAIEDLLESAGYRRGMSAWAVIRRLESQPPTRD